MSSFYFFNFWHGHSSQSGHHVLFFLFLETLPFFLLLLYGLCWSSCMCRPKCPRSLNFIGQDKNCSLWFFCTVVKEQPSTFETKRRKGKEKNGTFWLKIERLSLVLALVLLHVEKEQCKWNSKKEKVLQQNENVTDKNSEHLSYFGD